MAPANTSTKRMARSSYLPPLVMLLTLVIFGATIFLAWQHLRKKISEQILGHHAHTLYVLSVVRESEVPLGSVPESDEELFIIMLEKSQFSEFYDVLGTRLFSPDGNFADSLNATEAALAPNDLEQLQKLEPVIHFLPQAKLGDYFEGYGQSEESTAPLIEVIVPLHLENQFQLLGIGQYILDGRSLAAELSELDQRLLFQALAAFLVGGGIMVIPLGLAFRKLQRMNSLLVKANQELALAAKTSAVGSVTAHLIHGLKNPLFGLQTYMANRSRPEETQESEWQAALSSTRRMQSLVNEIVRVLREESTATQYEISFAELLEILESKTNPRAEAAKIHFRTALESDATMTNRQANLIILILENLIQNAIEATPPEKEVRLEIRSLPDSVLFEVSDQGTGIPEPFRETLFTPGHSTKQGGNGIGLAISKQLASHLGGQLELQKTGPEGSLFILTVPKPLLRTDTGAMAFQILS